MVIIVASTAPLSSAPSRTDGSPSALICTESTATPFLLKSSLNSNVELPEESEIHLMLTFPGRDEPVTLTGVVSHTVVVEDEDVPGMGIRFKFPPGADRSFQELIDKLDQSFQTGRLPEECLL